MLSATQGRYQQTFVGGEGSNERQDVALGGRFTMTAENSQLVLLTLGILGTVCVSYTEERVFALV